MRTEHDGRQAVLRTFPAADHVAGRVHADLQARLPHERHDVLPTGDIGVGKGDATDAPFGIPAEFAERIDPRLHARRVGRDIGVLCVNREWQQC